MKRLSSSPRVILLLAFFLPLLMLMGVYALQGIAPFGGKSLVILDARDQYISFSSFLAETIRSGNSLSYSLKMLLGGPLAGLIGYYLASPFEILFLVFRPEAYLTAFDMLIALKIALSGLTMALWFRERDRLGPFTLLFSSAYALSGFPIVFGWCVMWLDAVYMLPLIALGLDRIADKKSPVVSIVSLGLAIVINYYTGYMLCVFSVLYYAYLRIREGTDWRLRKQDGTFCVSSVASAALAAAMLLPVLAAMRDSADLSFANAIREYTYPAMTRLYQCILPALSRETVDRIILPTLVLTAVLSAGLLFLAMRACLKESMPWWKRIAFLAVFILAVELWHGQIDSYVISEEYAQNPAGTWGLFKLFFGEADIGEIYSGGPNVYVGPLLLLLSCLFFSLDGIPKRQKGAAGAVFLIYYLSLSLNFPNRVWHLLANNHMFAFRYSFTFSFFLIILAEESWRKRAALDRKKLVLTLFAALAAGTACLLWRKSAADLRNMLADLCLLAVSGGALLLCSLKNRRYSTAVCCAVQVCAMFWTVNSNYRLQAENAIGQQEYLQTIEEGNRKLHALRQLDSGLYRVRDTEDWLNMNDPLQFDFPGVSHFSSAEREGTTSFMSSIGAYSMESRFSDGNRGLSRAADTILGVRYLFSPFADYQEVKPGIYRNPYTTGLAVILPEVTAERLTAGNAAETLNAIFHALGTGDVYSAIEPQEEYEAEQASVMSFIIPEEEYYYLQLGREVPLELSVTVNGETQSCLREENDLFGNMLFPLGKLLKGQQLEIRVEMEESGEEKMILYLENSRTLEEYRLRTEKNPVKAECIRDDQIIIKTEVSDERGVLLLTLPAEKEWKATVDGAETETGTAFGLLLTIPVSEGSHMINLKYVPEANRTGLLISCISALGIAGYAVLFRERTRKKNQESVVER